ncbi:hypothetical protein ACU8WE_04130 [Pseudomonas parakoreensis]
MVQEYDGETGPASAVIITPANNGTIPPVPISVTGTTSLPMNIVLHLYRGQESVQISSGIINGNTWSRILNAHPPGSYHLEAIQASTSRVSFTIEVTTPIINEPSGDVTSPQFTVQGSGGLFNDGVITLYNAADNASLGNATIRVGGSWTANISLPVEIQPLTYYAIQKVGTYSSSRSNLMTVVLKVAPVIDSPSPGAVVRASAQLLITGRGTPGKTIDVMKPGGGVLHATALVKSNRTWEAPFNQDNYPNGGLVEMQAGHRGLNDWTATQYFTLLLRPTITTPSESAVTDPRGPIAGGGLFQVPLSKS